MHAPYMHMCVHARTRIHAYTHAHTQHLDQSRTHSNYYYFHD